MVWCVGEECLNLKIWDGLGNTKAHVTNNLRRAPHSISELLCSSGFCCKGPRQLHSLRQDTPLKVSWFLKRKHNSFHGGISAAFFEALAEVLDICERVEGTRAGPRRQVRFIPSQRRARLPHRARFHCWHVSSPPLRWHCHGAPWRRCHRLIEMSNGQVGAVRGVQTPCWWNTEEATEESDRKSKHDDSSDTSGGCRR